MGLTIRIRHAGQVHMQSLSIGVHGLNNLYTKTVEQMRRVFGGN